VDPTRSAAERWPCRMLRNAQSSDSRSRRQNDPQCGNAVNQSGSTPGGLQMHKGLINLWLFALASLPLAGGVGPDLKVR